MPDPTSPDRDLHYPFTSPTALEPPAEWAELRNRCPVTQVELPSGDTATLLTKFDDVKAALKGQGMTRLLTAPDAARLTTEKSGGLFSRKSASSVPHDPDGHQRWRRSLTGWFTARRMAAMRPRIEERTHQLIDQFVEDRTDNDPADLKAAVGFPLPVWVICEMLGVPDADRDRFSHWSDTMLNLTRYSDEEITSSQTEFATYLRELVRAKVDSPSDDIISALLDPGEGGPAMDEELIVHTAQGLLVAGHETTANMITKMVAMLLADRTRWVSVLDDRSLVPSTVEESLRIDANPGIGIPRYALTDVEINGKEIAVGTTLMCSMGAANQDQDVFTDADQMDLSRRPNTHIAFGAGPYSCLGQALARTELQVVLGVLLDRLPELELAVPADELERVEGLAVGGLRTLPVTW